MTSVAAVDCGTNAIRLLLVEQDKDCLLYTSDAADE